MRTVATLNLLAVLAVPTLPAKPSVENIRSKTVKRHVELREVVASPTAAPVTPSPVPAPEPPSATQEPAGDSVPQGSVEARIRATWPGNDEAALRVARCESNLDPNATGAAGERGLFQLHPVHKKWINAKWGWDAMYSVEPNVEAAWDLYQRSGGWGPWSCKP